MNIKSPMLASQKCLTFEDLKSLQWPKIGSIKKDGYRCMSLARGGVVKPISRYLKEIPNFFIQDQFEDFPPLFDGELCTPGTNFGETQSKLTTRISLPFKFKYYVFDHLGYKGYPYERRLQVLQKQLDRYCHNLPIEMMSFMWLENAKRAWEYFQQMIAEGEEGIILRCPHATYKEGRATFNEESMLKLKQWCDAEARIMGFEEEMENLNEKTIDARGYTKRSSHQANKKGKGTLGVIIGEDLETGEEVRVGSGWTDEEGNAIWRNRARMMHQIFTYKYTPYGRKEKARHPIWKGLRSIQI